MAPSTSPSAPAHPAPNVPAIAGLVMVLLATILSPMGLLGITLFILVPLGLGGMLLCAISLARRPRGPAIAGLIVGVLCIAGWSSYFAVGILNANALAGKSGLGSGKHVAMCMHAMELCEAAERVRVGITPAAQFDFTSVSPTTRTDPFGQPYRYILVGTPRGYTFMSNGPDGVANTADDIDLFAIQQGGMFSLPPPPVAGSAP